MCGKAFHGLGTEGQEELLILELLFTTLQSGFLVLFRKSQKQRSNSEHIWSLLLAKFVATLTPYTRSSGEKSEVKAEGLLEK